MCRKRYYPFGATLLASVEGQLPAALRCARPALVVGGSQALVRRLPQRLRDLLTACACSPLA
eukprot:7723188-Alexandrium_andersonii.AAC.1